MKAFVNGKFISCEEQNREFNVLVENKGKIVYTGDFLPEKYSKIKKIDLQGKCVVPAFADTHMHFSSFATFNSTVDVRDAKDFEDMGRMLQDYVKKNPKIKFVFAFGCTAHTIAEKRLPVRADLDKMVEKPLFIVKYDGHAGVANSALIKDFTENITTNEGFDAETGWLYQTAFYEGCNFISARIPLLSTLKGLVNAGNILAERGYGLIHTVEGIGFKNDLDVDSMRFFGNGFPSAFRIYFQTLEVEKVVKRKMTGIGGCFCLALDGCFGSQDAALSKPYCNDKNNKGFLLYTQDEINDFAIKANRAKLQMTIHAIGDVAVEQAITAYETALKDFPRDDHRHIIIHADLIPEHLQKRAASLGLYIALQPAFLDWKQEPGDYLESILGKDRVNSMIPLKSMIDKGLKLTSGSDAPCTLPDPLTSIYNCCNHPNPKESISILDALKVHTSWCTESSFDENKRGTLKEGLICDMVVLDKYILGTKPEELNKIKVEQTYLAGKPFKRVKSGLDLIRRSIHNKLFRKEFN